MLVFVVPRLKFLSVTASNFILQVPSIHDACSSLAHKEFTSLRVVYLTVSGTWTIVFYDHMAAMIWTTSTELS